MRAPRHISGADAVAPEGFCRWCKKPVQRPKRNWCGQACVSEYQIRSSAATARRAVAARDGGVCAQCGLDTEALRREVMQLPDVVAWLSAGCEGPCPDPRAVATGKPSHVVSFNDGKRTVAYTRTLHLWEMDHIVPVAEGGGACGLDNLRTLCIKCHRAATTDLRKRLRQISRQQEDFLDARLTADAV